jgi:L-lactate dehydrogenase (cytochrome)
VPGRVTGVGKALRREAGARARALGERGRAEGLLTVGDLRRAARRAVPRAVFDFVDGAACDEVTARRNCADFERWALVPRALSGVEQPRLEATVLGHATSFPLLGAPTGLTGLVHHLGELGLARALHQAGGIYVLSSMASYTIEEVVAGSRGPIWLQVYPWRDRQLVRSLLERARDVGIEVLVVTVDVAHAGPRERDARNGFGIPPRATPRTIAGALRRPRWTAAFLSKPRVTVANGVAPGTGRADPVSLSGYITAQFDPSATWKELDWFRGHWEGALVVKGILSAADARQALRAGVDAVVVSNHGGRQLDHTPSAITALPAIAAAVDGELPLILDGGIRRGSDVLKALALGASACMAGRPFVYGLAAAGQAGADRAVEILRSEVALAAALVGCPDLADLDRSWVTAA